MKLLSCLNNTSYRPRTVLGVSKMSSLEFQRFQNPDLNEDQILSKMKEQGKDPQEILAEHQRQIACEQNLAAVLRKLDISFRITKRIDEASKCMNWADMMVPIGGDGTFLLASKLITDNTKPVLGINPNESKHYNIFTLPSKYATDIRSIFQRLCTGEYALLMRSRIRTVFMGEFLASRPITLEVEVENQEAYQIRCSGICVCTGTGSRFWYRSINVQSPETVQRIIELATGKKLSLEEANKLLNEYHRTLIYSAEELKMTYMIREMYHATRCSRHKCCLDRQKCNKITVKSHGFDAGLVIDGGISLPFNDGTIATFDIKPEYSLRNIVLA